MERNQRILSFSNQKLRLVVMIFFSERRLALKLRTIVIGPVEIADMDNEVIRQIATEAESFHFKTATAKSTEATKG